MKISIETLETDIAKLKKDLISTIKFKKSLEKQKSDLLYAIKLAEQNLKYMKKRNAIPITEEYEKTNRSKGMAKKEVDVLDLQILQVENSINTLKKTLDIQNKKLEILKEQSNFKVLPFKRRR